MKLKYGSLALAVLCLAGCGKHDTPAATPSTANAPSTTPDTSGSNAAAAQAFADAQKAKEAEHPKADPSVPLANYTQLDQADGPVWLTYIAVSRVSPLPSDEEKLNMFSPKYFNEPDAFKKHDLIASELPPIQQNLKRYADQSYYAIKFGDVAGPNGAISPNIFFSSPYDFNTQSFQFNSAKQCWTMGYANNQNVVLDFSNTGSDECALKVTDVDTAKKIEQLRATAKLGAKGILYFHVDDVKNGNRVMATITHIHIDLYDAPAWDKRAQIFTSFDM
ncbi:hypothetical protein [Dyella mobilis]|uniref:Uncharacterized protein n=1 Tax=Dyella mobilis TaxID=1849582 RepID=A0ABS2KC37_9GAMM|nr:hypothetical protein [Dyella mobilis]MBM7128669.1 hypothetical protein [Dyella mobilis]GLQ98989.1 hypothetical protein GCM10007863_34090 [Dyella mobilis]